MCESSLFYFGLDIHNGPPQTTCFLLFKNTFQEAAQAFAISSKLCGLVALFAFFFHFGLYYRPKPENEDDLSKPKPEIEDNISCRPKPDIEDDLSSQFTKRALKAELPDQEDQSPSDRKVIEIEMANTDLQ